MEGKVGKSLDQPRDKQDATNKLISDKHLQVAQTDYVKQYRIKMGTPLPARNLVTVPPPPFAPAQVPAGAYRGPGSTTQSDEQFASASARRKLTMWTCSISKRAVETMIPGPLPVSRDVRVVQIKGALSAGADARSDGAGQESAAAEVSDLADWEGGDRAVGADDGRGWSGWKRAAAGG